MCVSPHRTPLGAGIIKGTNYSTEVWGCENKPERTPLKKNKKPQEEQIKMELIPGE